MVVIGQPLAQKLKINRDFSIIVMGRIGFKGVLPLRVVEGRLDHEAYIEGLLKTVRRDTSRSNAYSISSLVSHQAIRSFSSIIFSKLKNLPDANIDCFSEAFGLRPTSLPP